MDTAHSLEYKLKGLFEISVERMAHNVRELHSLFWIISRVGENPRVNSSLSTINALDDNAIGTSVEEIVIENNAPYILHQLTTTMSQNMVLLAPPSAMKIGGKILK